eukprot:1448169-Pleurochrysis_carterae.AAC.1
MKCDNQYRNQAEEELRACGESEEGWNDFKANALWHHLLHRTTAEAKPGDGAPKLSGAYKLGRAEARLATGQRLTSGTKESLDSVFTHILGVIPATLTNRRGLETRRPRTQQRRQTGSGARHRETMWCCKRLSRA